MKNKKGNIAVVVIVIVIVVITAGIIGWLFATKAQAPVKQPIVAQPVVKTQPTTQPIQQPSLPIVNLNKIIKEEAGKKVSHVTVEYKKGSDEKPVIIHEFVDELNSAGLTQYDPQYATSYLSQNYLVIQQCYDMAPCTDHLIDLKNMKRSELQFPGSGSVKFFENEKYVAFEGIGRVAQPGIAIEIINGRMIYCLISGEEVADVSVNNGIMSFAEHAFRDENGDGTMEDVATQKEVNIEDFCKVK